MNFKGKGLRILDFDLENRPLTYMGNDFTTADITAIAWAWYDEPKRLPYVYFQTRRAGTYEKMVAKFLEAYNEADMVTGHYILGHDLPIINGALLELGLQPLGPKLVSDTKVHLRGRRGVSASQESLGAMLGVEHQKYQMDQHKWRQANRLEPEGIDYAITRVQQDVMEHMEMRDRLLELGWLGPPKVWRGGAV